MKDKMVRQSILLAIFIHIAFAALSMVVQVSKHFENPDDNVHRFRVKSTSANVNLPQKRNAAVSPRQFAENLQKARKERAGSFEPVKDVPVKSLVKERTETPEAEIKPKSVESGRSVKNTDFERIVSAVEERKLKEAARAEHSSAGAEPQSGKARSPRVQPMAEKNLLETLKKPLQGVRWLAEDAGIDPEEGMPGFTPSLPAQGREIGNALDGVSGEARNEVTQYESLDAFLDVQVSTHEDTTDGRKYFRIKITPKKDAKIFKVMSKEILFAIDCSLSISPDRLEEFKKGIRFCLAHLNAGDLFNIVAFKDEAVFFSPEPIPATPEVIDRAERFVAGLTPSKRTDMHGALQKIVETKLNREPSNILLLSDGRPTYGIVDARELLASIARTNNKARPVFVYSGGAKVNRYLLDFIAYQNRAWSQFTKRTGDISKGLSDFYLKIKDPIFLHLRYRLHDVDEAEVYPKSLPDFYKNAEFTLYGTYRENENEFSMQLLGDIEGETKELVFTRSLLDAPKGGPDVMKGWAFNKIYYLINRITAEGNRPEILKEIAVLSQKYGIQTPYSPELQKLD